MDKDITEFQLQPITAEQFVSAVRKLGKRSSPFPASILVNRLTLHAYVVDLCRRTQTAGKAGISGHRLAEGLQLRSTRELRKLVAYARVAYGIEEVVGIPGSGYFWGPADPEIYKTAAGHAQRMGRDWMFLGALYGEGSAETNLAQMFLDFASSAGQKAAAGLAPEGPGGRDDLAELMERRNVSVGAVLDRILEFMSEHPDVYGEELRQIGRKHGPALVETAIIDELLNDARDWVAKLQRIALAGERNPKK